MIFILVGVAIIGAIAIAIFTRRSEQSAALGSMSEKWLAENRASRQ
jgi:hypothetical protein